MSNGRSGVIDGDQYRQGGADEAWLWQNPDGAVKATLILAHGAGAPMDSEFMNVMAQSLVSKGISVIRFEFAYMAARRLDGKKRPPNPQAQLLQQWRDVYTRVRQQVAGPLAVGGKSMGGRMASLLVDELGADALVCLGYPFYAAGKPEKPRVAHLAELKTPTLIVQGERDALGNVSAVRGYSLSPAVQVHWLEAADHDLKPLKSSGFTHQEHLESAAQAIACFLLR